MSTPTAITPVHAIQHLGAGNTIGAITGTITKVYADRKEGTNNHGAWSFQRATFRGSDGNEITIKFCNMPLIGQDWTGVPVAFRQSNEPKAKSITVDEYTNATTGVTSKSLKINETAQINWNPQGYQEAAPAGPPQQQQHAPQGPPQRQQGPPPAQHSAPPAQSPPQQRQSAPAPPQPPAHPGRVPIQGATVGMAMKLAGDLLIAEGLQNLPGTATPEFSRCLYELASDIIRISDRLGNGILAKSPSERKAKLAAARPDIVPDHSHDPVQNERERLANQWGQGPQDYPSQDERPPAFPSGGNAPAADDDEIPF